MARAVWLHAAEPFAVRSDVHHLLVVVAPDDLDDFRDRFAHDIERLRIDTCAGGAERFESVANALARIRADVDLVAVHDAARPA